MGVAATLPELSEWTLQMLSNKEFLSDRLPTQNGHGKVLNSLDQEGKFILLRIHLKFTLYFAVKLIAVVRI